MQPTLLEQPEHAPETGAAAIFEEVLDDAAAPGDRVRRRVSEARCFRYQRVSLRDPNSLSQLAFTGRPSPILGPRLSTCGVSGSDSALCVTAP